MMNGEGGGRVTWDIVVAVGGGRPRNLVAGGWEAESLYSEIAK
jgi:succinyl-CoA synthetase beta subunit